MLKKVIFLSFALCCLVNASDSDDLSEPSLNNDLSKLSLYECRIRSIQQELEQLADISLREKTEEAIDLEEDIINRIQRLLKIARNIRKESESLYSIKTTSATKKKQR